MAKKKKAARKSASKSTKKLSKTVSRGHQDDYYHGNKKPKK